MCLSFKNIIDFLIIFPGDYRESDAFKEIQAEASYLEWNCFRYIPDYDERKKRTNR